MSNKMVMVREHCPSLKLPAEITRQSQQATMQHRQPVGASKRMSRLVRSRGDEVCSSVCQSVCGRVRPGNGRGWHKTKVRNRHVLWQGCENTLASWTAVAVTPLSNATHRLKSSCSLRTSIVRSKAASRSACRRTPRRYREHRRLPNHAKRLGLRWP